MRIKLVWARKKDESETMCEVDNAGLTAVIGEITSLWAQGGSGIVGPDLHVEKTRVEDSHGEWKGFNYYLVSGEPRHLGPMRLEVEKTRGNSMDAKEAAEIATKNKSPADLALSHDDKVAVAYEITWALIMEQVRERSTRGKRKVFLEPFLSIGGLTREIEDMIIKRIVDLLREKQYKDIEWDRRDKRVVLRFSW